MTFAKEPAYDHDKVIKVKTGVLYCNLGTPDAPTPKATRRYLAQFLSDPRVVEIPRLLWLMILNGIILTTRPAKSAKKYASIWTEEGSPLLVHTKRQAEALQKRFDAAASPIKVLYAMRYGNPSIPSQLDAMKEAGIERILILPAYPQYSGTTTASTVDAVSLWTSVQRNIPELRFVKHYHDHPGYIAALACSVRAHWEAQGRAQHLIMSFHGVPERTLHAGDPYHCECQKTGRLLAEELGLQKGDYSVTFQSRFGKAKWLEPYTEPRLVKLAQDGVKQVNVICPGFTSDCLETLEEIQIEAKAAFVAAGGETFSYIPCLNESEHWIAVLEDLTRSHASGWL